MNIKQFLAVVSLFAGCVPCLHAADAPARDQQDADTPVLIGAAMTMPVVTAPVVSATGKTREQVITELVDGIKDGSYVAPSEIYPVMVAGTLRR